MSRERLHHNNNLSLSLFRSLKLEANYLTSQPPPSFQPQPPASTQQPSSTAARPNPNVPTVPIDLISRYNLATKVSSNDNTAEESVGKGWAASKADRQASLQRRREEMVLAARRKMEERDKARAS